MVEKIDANTLSVQELRSHATALRADAAKLGKTELARRKLLEAISLEHIAEQREGVLTPAQELGW